MDHPMIVYHRGRHGIEVDGVSLEENTLPAFEQAIVEGAEMIEFDVWAGLRVAHDPEDLNVPTLHDVLDLVQGRCRLNVEIKSPKAAAEALSVIDKALWQESWSPDRFVISAFDHETALLCKRAVPHIRVGVINDGVLLPSYIEQLRAEGVDNLHLDWGNIYMDIDKGCSMRELIRRNGMELWVWTINKPDIYKVVSDYGADAVFTDKPDMIKGLQDKT